MMVLGITVQRVYMHGSPRCWWLQAHGQVADAETVPEARAAFEMFAGRERCRRVGLIG